MARRVLLAAIVLVLGIPAAALADGPDIRDHDVIDEVDSDFCGTGQSVLVDGTVDFTGWVGETGGDPEQVIKLKVMVRITYTNPKTGAAAAELWSFSGTNRIVAGTEAAAHTHEFVERGLKATFKLVNGRLLTRDAGSLTYRVSFDAADNEVDFQLVDMNGPHPGFDAGDIFCSTLVPALGLD